MLWTQETARFKGPKKMKEFMVLFYAEQGSYNFRACGWNRPIIYSK